MNNKKCILFGVLFVFLIQFLLLYKCNRNFVDFYRMINPLNFMRSFNHSNIPLSEEEEQLACKIPELNPWDPLISGNIFHPKNLACKLEQPFLTFIDFNGYLTINKTEANVFKALNKTFSCFYWAFDRMNVSTDNVISYDDKIELIEPVQIDKDHVKVKCFFHDDSENFYFNLHAHPSKKRLEQLKYKTPKDDQLSVLMYFIDSVSYSVLQRNLPLTFNYTTKVMDFKYFKAFNKVGDNSLPNWMAMLMGKRVLDEQDDMLREMEGDYSKIRYDSWPLIWKNFSKNGYLTVWNEDNPQVGIFTFEARGFRRKPVDYYYPIFWSAVQAESNHDYICFQNEPKARMIMDLTKRHIMATHDKLQFMITTTMELSHDVDNQVELTDDDLMAMWKFLYEGNYLNKTVVIFASDHGLRLGIIRSTLIGLLEERLPFYGIWFPPWFYEKYPQIKENLENNAHILSSHYDVHETLSDILNANFNSSQRGWYQRGQSQLYPLPKNRTCNMAGIPDHYCTCHSEIDLEMNGTLAVESGSFLVDHLNELLANYSTICHNISLSKILFAKLVDVNEKVRQGVHNIEEVQLFEKGETIRKERVSFKDIRIGIQTEPNQASFDALIRKSFLDDSSHLTIASTISRTSKYGKTADCMHEKSLKKFCTCINT